jgi:putative holliday junction resolvase
MQQQPRILGLDVGDRRIGIAISDAFALSAQPLLTLNRSNRRNDLRMIERLVRKHAVTEFVVGHPLYMSGDVSPQAAKTEAFAAILREEFELPVHLIDERLTTTEAHRHLDTADYASRRKAVIDQVAAVLILQLFLDTRANQRLQP